MGGEEEGVHVAHVRRRERAEPEEGEGVGGVSFERCEQAVRAPPTPRHTHTP